MRLSARDITYTVTLVDIPDAARPVRLRVTGLVYAMTETEALDLADKLADGVDEIRHKERTQTP
jgi:hypothetical protein